MVGLASSPLEADAWLPGLHGCLGGYQGARGGAAILGCDRMALPSVTIFGGAALKALSFKALQSAERSGYRTYRYASTIASGYRYVSNGHLCASVLT